jgi:hypothetical protein
MSIDDDIDNYSNDNKDATLTISLNDISEDEEDMVQIGEKEPNLEKLFDGKNKRDFFFE